MLIFEKLQISCNLRDNGVVIASVVETQLLSPMITPLNNPCACRSSMADCKCCLWQGCLITRNGHIFYASSSLFIFFLIVSTTATNTTATSTTTPKPAATESPCRSTTTTQPRESAGVSRRVRSCFAHRWPQWGKKCLRSSYIFNRIWFVIQ